MATFRVCIQWSWPHEDCVMIRGQIFWPQSNLSSANILSPSYKRTLEEQFCSNYWVKYLCIPLISKNVFSHNQNTWFRINRKWLGTKRQLDFKHAIATLWWESVNNNCSIIIRNVTRGIRRTLGGAFIDCGSDWWDTCNTNTAICSCALRISLV